MLCDAYPYSTLVAIRPFGIKALYVSEENRVHLGLFAETGAMLPDFWAIKTEVSAHHILGMLPRRREVVRHREA